MGTTNRWNQRYEDVRVDDGRIVSALVPLQLVLEGHGKNSAADRTCCCDVVLNSLEDQRSKSSHTTLGERLDETSLSWTNVEHLCAEQLDQCCRGCANIYSIYLIDPKSQNPNPPRSVLYCLDNYVSRPLKKPKRRVPGQNLEHLLTNLAEKHPEKSPKVHSGVNRQMYLGNAVQDERNGCDDGRLQHRGVTAAAALNFTRFVRHRQRRRVANR